MNFPRPIQAIHQIEVTSRCNLRCRYCPSPKQAILRNQEPMDMTMDTFERSLEWARTLNSRYVPHNPGMAELSLTGIGEALLHPEFVTMVRLAREALPHSPIVFSTNGLLLDDAMCKALAPYNPNIYVSLHRPEKAGHAIQNARRYGLLSGYNESPATSAFDWAGQIDWFVSAPPMECEYLRSGWGVILCDGRVTTCCLDASALGVVGHVDDPIGSLSIKPFSLCEDCHMTIPVPYEQPMTSADATTPLDTVLS